MRKLLPDVVVGAVLIGAVSLADAQPATKADIAKLQQQINEHRRILTRLGDLQKQYLNSLQAVMTSMPSGGGGGNGKAKGPDKERVVEKDRGGDKGGGDEGETTTVAATPVGAAGQGGKGTVVGKVAVKGGDPGDVWIYVEDIAAPAAKGTATMKQENKQFTPKVLVVQKGTKVGFPNGDPIFHNVFSVTPGSPFDLGSYPQGESREVTMAKPGVVSVYCNMHSQMVGHILVTPNGLFTRTGKDGFYRLANVPSGRHRIAAWTPHGKVAVQEVEVPASGVVTVELALQKGKAGAHLNKDGQAYGDYKQ